MSRMTAILLALMLIVACDSKNSSADSDTSSNTSTTAETTAATDESVDEPETGEVVEVKSLQFGENKFKYKDHMPPGDLRGGFGYVDKSGENFFVFTQEEVPVADGPNSVVLHIGQVRVTDEGTKQVRVFKEAIEGCDVDIIVEPHWTEFSMSGDIDQDGLAEAVFGYTAGCQGGMDGVPHRTILVEGDDVYQMVGKTKSLEEKIDDNVGATREKTDEMPLEFETNAGQFFNESALKFLKYDK